MGIQRVFLMIDTIAIRRPDDWHVHLRDGAMMASVLPHTARQFARAIVMPNLAPPVTTIAAAVAYRQRIMAALPAGVDFTPLMTAYLTDASEPDEIGRGHREPSGRAPRRAQAPLRSRSRASARIAAPSFADRRSFT